jgi:hypothetical protein
MHHHLDAANLLLRFAYDLVAITGVCAMVARRRPRRGLFMVFAAFNVGLFVVVTVLSSQHVGPAVGFALFGMLAIVRLRSEPFGNADLAYFFSALVLALANGVHLADGWVAPAGSLAVLIVLYLVDHPSLYRRTARQDVTLDAIHADHDALRADLEARLGVPIVDLVVRETDYVREVTQVSVRYLQPPGVPESGEVVA